MLRIEKRGSLRGHGHAIVELLDVNVESRSLHLS